MSVYVNNKKSFAHSIRSVVCVHCSLHQYIFWLARIYMHEAEIALIEFVSAEKRKNRIRQNGDDFHSSYNRHKIEKNKLSEYFGAKCLCVVCLTLRAHNTQVHKVNCRFVLFFIIISSRMRCVYVCLAAVMPSKRCIKCVSAHAMNVAHIVSKQRVWQHLRGICSW